MISSAPISPVLATDVAREIRAVGGVIWLLQKPDRNFVIHAELGRKQFRIVLPPTSGEPISDIPLERNNPFYIAHDLDGLRNWLESIRPDPASV